MSVNEQVQYLSTTEFANCYNAMMPIDKDHLPLEPSFVELLCKKGEIEHSELQPGKGNKKFIYKIPEYELDRVAILINGDEFVKGKTEETKPNLISERTLLTTKDVAELLGCHRTNVNVLVRKGKLVPAKVEKHGALDFYKFDEDYILKYMEENPRREHKKKEKPIQVKQEPEDDIKTLQDLVNKLLAEISESQDEIRRLTADNKRLNDLLAIARSSAQEPVAKDIFEAYRKGFKDGYEMGGKQ